MIQLVARENLDVTKYDACVEHSLQSNIYGFSWYMDVVCDNWSALVLDDYNAVMPVPWRKKWFIKYVYPPFWVIQLGLYSKQEVDEDQFLRVLFSKFKYVEFKSNTENKFSTSKHNTTKQLQYLNLNQDYKDIQTGYKRDRKRDLKKAKDNKLSALWNDQADKLIDIIKSNVGKRLPNVKAADYDVLLKLIEIIKYRNKGEILSIYDSSKNLVGSSIYVKHKNSVTILASSTDFSNRKYGVDTFMRDAIIAKYASQLDYFYFGGSSIKSIAKNNLSFGSKTKTYQLIKHNNLPKLIRYFKK